MNIITADPSLKLVFSSQGQYFCIAAHLLDCTSARVSFARVSACLSYIYCGAYGAMNRDDSPSSAASTPGYIGAKRLPPWEVSEIPRVPHIQSAAPPLSKAEMEALSSLWSTRSTPDHHRNYDVDGRFPDSAFAAPSPPSRTTTGSFSGRKPSLTDSARAVSPQPSEHRNMSPGHGRVHEHVPSASRQQVVALPGTMSSRSTVSQPHPNDSKRPLSKRQHKKGSKDLKESVPIGHRFTSAVKDLFRREPVDDSHFERIGDRHWSED